MRALGLVGLFLGLGCWACGGGTDTTGAGGGAATGSGSGGGQNNQTFTVTYDPITVAPGEEDTKCIVKRLGNDEQVRIHEIQNVLPNGSHHLIIYRTTDTVEQPEPYACQPFSDTLDPSKGSPIMVTQKPADTLTLPEAVGFTFAPGAMVRLEMHYINTTSEPLDVSATSTFVTMPEAEFQHEADFVFAGNPDIEIQANSTETLGPTFLPLPEVLQGVTFFGITGHTHKWGTDVTVAAAVGPEDSGTPVYDVDNFQWDEPETVYHDPGFTIEAGGGFRFSCSWDNKSNQTVGFGESAGDEMCFFWAYYYPSRGAYVCAHTDQVPGGYDICCPGNAFCDQLF